MDNLREIEYSQIVRTKLMNLRVELAAEYGEKFSRKALGKITKAVRSLEVYCDMGTKITYYNEFMKDLNNPEGYIERRQRDFLRLGQQRSRGISVLAGERAQGFGLVEQQFGDRQADDIASSYDDRTLSRYFRARTLQQPDDASPWRASGT